MKKSTFFRFYPLLTLMFFNFQDTLIAQTCVNNLLQNPGFESNLSSWQTALAEIATTPVASGTKSLKLCTQSGSATQTLAATAGKTYKIQYSAKTAGTNQNILFGLKFLSATWQVLGSDYSSFDSPTSFTSNSLQKLAPTGTAWVEVAIYKQNNGCIYVDDMCLTESGVNPNPCSPDVTAPVIANCPANVNVIANVGATLAAVQWIAPTTTDNCTGTVNLASTHPIGSNFPIGSTTVTYTAKDVANNSATCSFIVTVTSQNTGNGCVGNLLGNSGFESNNFDSWGIVGTPTIVAGGNGTSAKAVLLSPPSAYRIYQLKPATVGKVYEMRAFAKTTVSMSVGILAIKFFDASWNLIGDDKTTTFSPTANFLEYSVTRVAPLGSVYIEATALGNTGSVLFDDFCLIDNGVAVNQCVSDQQPPVFQNCPADISVTTPSTTAVVSWPNPVAVDNCSAVTYSIPNATNAAGLFQINPSGLSFPIGLTQIDYRAFDVSLNQAPCIFHVVVLPAPNSPCANDVTPPAMTNCPADIFVETSGTSAFVSWTEPVFTDNCSMRHTFFTSSIADNLFNNSIMPLGSRFFSYEAFDVAGNFTNCVFNVTVAQITPGNCANNLLQNGGFENGLNNWTTSTGTGTGVLSTDVASGIKSLKVCGIFSNTQKVAAVEGELYELQGKVKAESLTNTSVLPVVVLRFLNQNNQPIALPSGANNVSFSFSNTTWADLITSNTLAPIGTKWIEVSLQNKTANTCAYFDDLCLTKVTGNPANCTTQSNDPWHEWISNVKIGTLEYASSKAPLNNGSNISFIFNLSKNSPNTLNLTTSFSYFTYDEYYRVWIDYNRNGSLGNNEVVFEGILTRPADGTASKTLTGSIIVPANVSAGLALLRISMRRGAYPAACGDIDFGEAEDYSLNITNNLQSGTSRADAEDLTTFEKLSNLDDYDLFPNPATEMVYIKMSTPPSDGVTQSHPITTIKLLNQLGKVEKVQEFSSINEEEIHEFSLQDISNGVYFMQIETAGKRAVVKKLVVSRMY
jgi:hypothetical protein